MSYLEKKLLLEGKEYDLYEWLTIAEYCKVHQIKNTQTVSNWILRGIVPLEDILIVPELNHLKLLRNKQYSQV
jgi:hypothetical protein